MLNGVARVSENKVSELAKLICTGLGYRKKAATKMRMAVNIAVTRTFNFLFGFKLILRQWLVCAMNRQVNG